MTTQHTPSPWTVHINYASANYTVFDADGNYGETDGDTLIANAALMAAAPELLAALRQWAEYAEQNGGDEAYSFNAATRAAIARATGGAQ
jgi:hypothetical protein